MFKQSVNLAADWEKPHFCYAKFLDQLMTDARQRQTTTKAGTLLPCHMLFCLSLSLCSASGL